MKMIKAKPFLMISAVFGLSLFLCLACKPSTSENVTEKKPLKIVEEVPEIMPYDSFSYPEFDVIASYLSGITPSDSVLSARPEFRSAGWKQFSKRFTAQWNNFKTGELNTVFDWTQENISYTDSIFYPFSGPDFNYLNSFFPDAKFSLMIALEPVGSIPDLSKMDDTKRLALLEAMEKSLYFNLKCSFFRTFSMEDELSSEVLDGTIPLILLFLKSHGYEIVNIYPVEINENGILRADTADNMFARKTDKSFENAAAFVYRNPADSSLRELVYMSLDLSDKGIEADNLAPFLTNYISGNTVFLKAASYLCHKPPFSKIRDLMLKNATQIISDPSGINFDDYDESWDLSVHGQYVGPIRLFGSRVQDNLKAETKRLGNKNLPFRFGYHYTHWCLIDAKKK
jgi:hypothetical protein